VSPALVNGFPDLRKFSSGLIKFRQSSNVFGLDSEADHRGRQREQRQGLRSKTDLIANIWTMKFTAHESLY